MLESCKGYAFDIRRWAYIYRSVWM